MSPKGAFRVGQKKKTTGCRQRKGAHSEIRKKVINEIFQKLWGG